MTRDDRRFPLLLLLDILCCIKNGPLYLLCGVYIVYIIYIYEYICSDACGQAIFQLQLYFAEIEAKQ